MTKEKHEKKCFSIGREIALDMCNDPNWSLEDAASDYAHSIMQFRSDEDQELIDFVEIKLKVLKQFVGEKIADDIYEGMISVKKG